jgi:hypothetical protein
MARQGSLLSPHLGGGWTAASIGRSIVEIPTADEASMVRAAVSNLEERFATIDHDRIASTVQRRVQERCANARVTTFVGIIAEREARAELDLVQAECEELEHGASRSDSGSR